VAVVTPATVTVAAVAPGRLAVLAAPPLVEVQETEYPVMAAPLSAGVVNVTLSDPVAVVVEFEMIFSDPGAAGAPAMVDGLLAVGPVPTAFFAATRNV
jgi:hypothetical protein